MYLITSDWNGLDYPDVWLKPKVSYTHETIVSIYIVYELGASGSHNDDPALKNCLFGAVTLTKLQTLINVGTLVIE